MISSSTMRLEGQQLRTLELGLAAAFNPLAEVGEDVGRMSAGFEPVLVCDGAFCETRAPAAVLLPVLLVLADDAPACFSFARNLL
jgi:hypothetical protein